ncbi:MAG: 50S ribosomal protein L6 [Actinomycetota bacterium]
MSRVGNAPITVPGGVDISIDGSSITVKGSKGELSRELPGGIVAAIDDGTLTVTRPDDSKESRAYHGLCRSLIQNMIVGVNEGFIKELQIQGVGYRATAKGSNALELALGFSHPVSIEAPEGIEFEVPAQTQILVKGIDKQLVGQVAADIRKWRKPEPYKGKGIRYKDERVIRKAGKAAK